MERHFPTTPGKPSWMALTIFIPFPNNNWNLLKRSRANFGPTEKTGQSGLPSRFWSLIFRLDLTKRDLSISLATEISRIFGTLNIHHRMLPVQAWPSLRMQTKEQIPAWKLFFGFDYNGLSLERDLRDWSKSIEGGGGMGRSREGVGHQFLNPW